ncbi:hypothetical protein [Paenibacillus sp. GXUN7292]|uniref:hypothetical protein n=1 Tax=Paenibacillus sp. GXUN7292 TaxID=3422499 RepID=UPI003D7CA880
MDEKMHQRFKGVRFSEDQTSMFADIVETDTALKRIFMTIVKLSVDNKDDATGGAVTIKQLLEHVKLTRKVQTNDEGQKKYKLMDAPIDRKQAERKMDVLFKMSLCYYVSVAPAKLIYPTERGTAVCSELLKRVKSNKIN